MNKVNLFRSLGECGLGAGCIAGGVECSRAKSSLEPLQQTNEELTVKNSDLETKNENLTNDNANLKTTYTTVNGYNVNLKKENDVFKECIKYMVEWIKNTWIKNHKPENTDNWMKQQAPNLISGCRERLLKQGQQIDLGFTIWT